MNTLYFACTLLLTLLLLTTLFASSVILFFTNEELAEMGVRIEPFDAEEGFTA